jgi:hypothetical protein
LYSGSETYQVAAALVEPRGSLAETYDYVVERMAEYPEGDEYRKFRYEDELAVPEMAWRLTHNFSELEKKLFLNEGFTDQFVDRALQTIEFKLNKEGVELKSEAVFAGETAMAPTVDARRLVFDRPFLIFIKKRDADTPVFAMWVDNNELLKAR